MGKEITFILEPDRGRLTLESSQASNEITDEIKTSLGKPISLNCGRPNLLNNSSNEEREQVSSDQQAIVDELDSVYLYQIYHGSTVDGPGRRSVVQFAGCSIRCVGCYVPETHLQSNGSLIVIKEIISKINKRSGEHDGVTILGGEPFDQIDGLEKLVVAIKKRKYHLTIYTGYKLESLMEMKNESIEQILKSVDLLIDGAFDVKLSKDAGEYRGSSNQRMLYQPLRKSSI